jgi:hypothetical protein
MKDSEIDGSKHSQNLICSFPVGMGGSFPGGKAAGA